MCCSVVVAVPVCPNITVRFISPKRLEKYETYGTSWPLLYRRIVRGLYFELCTKQL